MTGDSFVSVIIDNYNYGRFIGEAIDSVLEQTYTNYELIIVDDGSKDNSREIIERYAQRYPNKIVPVYKTNGGQASAFNAGFSVAKGDVIAFLDSDDYWYPTKLEAIAKAHEKHTVVQHNLWLGDKKFIEYLKSDAMQVLFKKHGFFANFMPTSALSFHRRPLEKIFPLPDAEAVKICADAYIISLALYFEDIYSLNECLGFYRIHGSNYFRGSTDNTRLGRVTEEINKKLIKDGLEPVPYYPTQAEALVAAYPVDSTLTYLIYGTGTVAQRLYERIVANGYEKVRYFSDSEPQKWGSQLYQVEIINPEDIQKVRPNFDKIIIGSSYIEDILTRLSKLGFVPGVDVIYPGMDLLKG